MVDNVQDIELGTLGSGGWDTSSAPVASQPNVYQAVTDPTVNSDISIGVRIGDVWINTATKAVFDCLSAADGAAIWRFRPRAWNSTGASTTLTGTTNETELARLSLPAGLPGTNGVFEVRNAWLVNNDASTKTGSTKIGAAAAAVGSCTALRSAALASVLTLYEGLTFKNDGSASVQLGLNSLSSGVAFGTAAGAQTTAAINTGNAFDLVWTGTLADGNDSLTLKAWTVTLTRPDIGP